MKINPLFTAVAAVVLSSCGVRTSIIWQEGAVQEDGRSEHVIYVCNPPKGDDWSIWASCYNVKPDFTAEGDMEMRHFNGWCYYFTPVACGKDTLVLKYRSAPIKHLSHMPEGFAMQLPGKAEVSIPVEYRTLGDEEKKNCFSWTYSEPAMTDMIPALKSVIPAEGITEVAGYEPLIVPGHKSGRSFYTVDEVKTIIEILSRYRINCLQLHLTEDEGWRIEIDGLPELTSYGAYHKLPKRQSDGSYLEVEAPHPSFDGSFDPADRQSNTQGYYSREDMIEIIRFAADHHIGVSPEGTARLLDNVALEKPENIYGTGAFLWGENIRNFDQATYAMFPKAYGLFDRAWNARPEWDEPSHRSEEEMQAAFDRFYSAVVKYELPWLDSNDINYRQL